MRQYVKQGLLVVAAFLVASFAGGPAQGQDEPTLVISSPVEGTVLTPGQVLEVRIAAAHPELFTIETLVSSDALGISSSAAPASEVIFSITVPEGIVSGTYFIGAVASLTSGGRLLSKPVTVRVSPQGVGTRLVPDRSLAFDFPGDSLPLNIAIDGSQGLQPVDPAFLAFVSHDTSIVTVSDQGIVVAKAPGRTQIEVRYAQGGSSLSVIVDAWVGGGRVGDLDGDGRVTKSDRNRLKRWLGHEATGADDARDLNHDGKLDEQDLAALTELCDSSCPPLDSAPPRRRTTGRDQ